MKMFKRILPFMRRFSTQCPAAKEEPKMRAWRIHEYGPISNLNLEEARIPLIDSPNKLLVEVKAASLNPIDILMLDGYGKTLFKIQRGPEIEFPLIIGRDFCGKVLSKGHGVENVNVGDEVYGFLPIHKQGAFSEIVLAESQHVLPKPKHLSAVESASLVYATMTAWSALFFFGKLLTRQREGLRVLILGASGGVGTCAVQLLKSQNCVVYATCSSNAKDLLYSLSADCVFDYKDPDFEKVVALEGRYHIILDCAQTGYKNIPASWKYDTYISLNSPLLKNTDKYGLVPGLFRSANEYFGANVSKFLDRSRVKWGFFTPSSTGFQFINDLVLKQQLKPIMHKVFPFEKLPDALTAMQEGHLRGKIAMEFKN